MSKQSKKRKWHYAFTYPKTDDGLVTAWAKPSGFPQPFVLGNYLMEVVRGEREEEPLYFEYGRTTVDALEKLKAQLPDEPPMKSQRFDLLQFAEQITKRIRPVSYTHLRAHET